MASRAGLQHTGIVRPLQIITAWGVQSSERMEKKLLAQVSLKSTLHNVSVMEETGSWEHVLQDISLGLKAGTERSEVIFWEMITKEQIQIRL